MTDSERYQHLLNHYNDLRYADGFTINRVNYRFLINECNKSLKLKEENTALKREMKKLKAALRIEENLSSMQKRMDCSG